MPEYYTLIEMELYQAQTMPPTTSSRPVLLHAVADGEDGEITAACSYPVVPQRDVPKRGLPFSARSVGCHAGIPLELGGRTGNGLETGRELLG